MIFFSGSKKFFIGLVVLVFIVFGFLTAGAEVLQFPPGGINPSIPGSSQGTQTNPDPVGIIGNIFQFSLLIGGLLAFVMIVYGGIEYAASGDSGSGQKEAKDRIQQALLGLLLLAGSFVLLQTINPQLTKLEFPDLESVTGEVPLYRLSTSTPQAAGGRCINNQCSAGNFCFRDNICYEYIDGCSVDANEFDSFSGGMTNDYCVSEFKKLTGKNVLAVCAGGTCYQLDDSSYTMNCSEDPNDCQSGTSCVNGICKYNGTEGARCKDSSPKCVEPGVECSPTNFCRRVGADDVACGDQMGSCGQGTCQMDRVNIGKFVCSTVPGPDGVCMANQTIQQCNALFGQVGGYCHAGSCYGNNNPAGPFPLNP